MTLRQGVHRRSQNVSAPPGLRESIERRVSALRKSAWWKSIAAHLKGLVLPGESPRLLCYGLGSVFATRNAEWQLAFAIALKEMLGSALELRDPVTSTTESEWRVVAPAHMQRINAVAVGRGTREGTQASCELRGGSRTRARGDIQGPE